MIPQNHPLDSRKSQDFILQDLSRWMKDHPAVGSDPEQALRYFFTNRQEFRSIVHYRATVLQKRGGVSPSGALQHHLGALRWGFVQNLFLACQEIGPGLYVEHGFSTIVWAKSIGRNFRINQNVTVGTGKGGNPTIGDDVSIYTGSIVIGPIHVGNRVKIGAGAVVREDVPDGATVVPAASRIILRE
jgi:serine O-acetyltransferase